MCNHIYYDVSYLNNTTLPQPVTLLDNRSTPLVKNPKAYHLSVVRFTIPTSYIPIFIWPESSGNAANNTFYSVTINSSQVFLVYVPQNTLTTNDANFRFVYSYQQFVDAINVALNAAFIAATPAGTTTPPYMIFDPATGLFSIIAEAAYASHQICFNQNLYAFFDNFDSKRFGYNQVLGRDVQIYIKNNGNNDHDGHPPGYPLVVGGSYIMTQEYDSTYLWNDARSVVFTSSTLPVADEALNVSNTSSQTTQSTYRKILTDFEFSINPGSVATSTLRSYVQYHPTAEYRLINLISESAIYTVDIQVYFQTKDLRLYPLYINPGESATIKILFRSRN